MSLPYPANEADARRKRMFWITVASVADAVLLVVLLYFSMIAHNRPAVRVVGMTHGTIFIALFSPAGVWSKKLSYPGPRPTVKVRAVNAALDWLRRELLRAQRGTSAPSRRIGMMQ